MGHLGWVGMGYLEGCPEGYVSQDCDAKVFLSDTALFCL